jgi:hypothetical protein
LVWLRYELVFRLATGRQTEGRPYGGGPAMASRTHRPSFTAGTAATAGSALPTALRRAGGAGKT